MLTQPLPMPSAGRCMMASAWCGSNASPGVGWMSSTPERSSALMSSVRTMRMPSTAAATVMRAGSWASARSKWSSTGITWRTTAPVALSRMRGSCSLVRRWRFWKSAMARSVSALAAASSVSSAWMALRISSRSGAQSSTKGCACDSAWRCWRASSGELSLVWWCPCGRWWDCSWSVMACSVLRGRWRVRLRRSGVRGCLSSPTSPSSSPRTRRASSRNHPASRPWSRPSGSPWPRAGRGARCREGPQ